MAGGFGAFVAGEPDDGGGAVLRKDRPLRESPLSVEVCQLITELFGGLGFAVFDLIFRERLDDAVAGEHGGAGDDGGGRDAVHADQRAEADGEFADEVVERGFADVIRFAAVFGDDGVGGTGEHHGGGQFLVLKDGFGFLREEEVAGDVDEEGGVPLGVGQFAAGAGAHGEDGGGVDHAVDAAEFQNGVADGGGEAFGRAEVGGGVRDGLARRELRDFDGDVFGGFRVDVRNHEVRAALREHEGDFAADAAAAADNEDDFAAELGLGGHALQLGFFKRPVFDLEGFGTGQGHVVVGGGEVLRLLRMASLGERAGDLAIFESGRAGHDVDGVDEELGGDAGFLLILAEAEDAEAGDDDDGGVGVAELGRIGESPVVVIGGVFGAVGDGLFGDALFQDGEAFGGLPVDEQGADAGAEEVVRAGGAEAAEFFGPGGAGEDEGVFVVGVVGDLAAVGGADAAEGGQDGGGDGLAVLNGGLFESAEDGAFFGLAGVDEAAHLVNGFDGVDVAFALGVAPSEEAVAAEDEAVGVRVFLDAFFEHEGEFEAGALPGDPDDVGAEFLVIFAHFALAVGAGGDGDGPVGVEVVDVIPGEEGVEGGVDGGGDFVVAEGGEGVEGDHLILKGFAAVDVFELGEAVHIEEREAGFLNGADVAAGAFDGHDAGIAAGEGVGHFVLGAGVAAAEVGDAEVGAEQVGTVAEQG